MATATTVDQRARSLELAAAKGYTLQGPARTLGAAFSEDGRLISLAVRVASASSDAVYIVTYQTATDRAACECPAAAHARPCWHAGVGLAGGRYVARRAALGFPED